MDNYISKNFDKSYANDKSYNIDKSYSNNNTDNISQTINDDGDVKHIKYKNKYIANDTYYGLGIENETYLMSDKTIERSGEWILKNHARERYSVDYWRNFKNVDVDKALFMIEPKKKYKIPVFINSYTIMKCDKNLQHRTMYTKNTEPNPKFEGKTIHDLLTEKSDFFRENLDNEFVYDGDTIEFTTLDFYKTTVDKCVDQLIDYKTRFITEINKSFIENDILKSHYDNQLSYSKNFGLVNFVTNPRNISICNNSTYHINITLPTKLNNFGRIKNYPKFHKDHSNAIRAIQWIEPMLIACYGSPDIFSVGNDNFSKGSLRIALSRYVGACTYDTEKMPEGKLLKCFEFDPTLTENDQTVLDNEVTTDRNINQYANIKEHWYKRYHTDSGYISQKTIGFDVNYQKHYNHGIELRIFDYFPEEYLKDILNILLLVCQLSLLNNISDPRESTAFDDQMIECVKSGTKCIINQHYVEKLESIFCHKNQFKLNNNKSNIVALFQEFIDCMYNNLCNKEFMKQISPNMQRPIVVDFNSIMFNMNKNFLYYGDYYYIDPVQPIIIQSDPVQPIIIQSDPVQPIIIQSDPIQTVIIQSDPVQPVIIQSDPVQPIIIQSDPVQPIIIQSDPIQTVIIQSDPVQPIIIQSDPVQPIIIQSDPVQPIIIQSDPIQPIIIQSDPIQTVIIQSDPVQPIIVQSDPVQPIIIQSDPIQNVIVQSDPVQPIIIQSNNMENSSTNTNITQNTGRPIPRQLPASLINYLNRDDIRDTKSNQSTNNTTIKPPKSNNNATDKCCMQ
jgi:hypothetical protein